MLAGEVISNTIRPLQTSDTVRKALALMNEFKLYHLPVLNEKQYLGLVSEEQLMEERDQDNTIGALPLTLLKSFVFESGHIYDVIKLLSELQLSVVPVLDEHRNYVGVIAINNVLHYAANLYSVTEPGGIIVLSISNVNNSLAHMAQVVEANNAQILSSYITSFPDSDRLEVTLKINKTELSAIVASFERYEYQVKAVFNNSNQDNSSMDRFDSFMNYLNV